MIVDFFQNDNLRSLRWLNTVLRVVSGNSHDGACFKLDKQTWRQKTRYTENDLKIFSLKFVIFGRIFPFIVS